AARAGDRAAYLELFGDEAPVWDVAVATYAEDPSKVPATLPSPLPSPRQAGRGLGEGSGDQILDEAVALAREAAAGAEDDAALYARVQAAVRRALLAQGRRLVQSGVLASADDVFWLPLEAVRRDARGEAALDAADAARAVADARAAYQRALADPPPLG